MDYSLAQTLITTTLSSFGAAAIVILAAVIGVAIGLLVFRWGWRKVTSVAGEGSSYMHSYDGIDLDAVSSATRNAIRRSYPKNTEGI